MTLRYMKVTFYPRKQERTARGALSFAADLAHPHVVRAGISADRSNRAEVRGDVEVEVYNIRLPLNLPGVGPGARIKWDDSDWDVIAPSFARPTRTHSVRHQTAQIQRRPFREGERD